jgi:hypothetical protein
LDVIFALEIDELISGHKQAIAIPKNRQQMTPPQNAEIFEGELATFWFDQDGVLNAVSKNISRTLQKQKDNYDFIKKITGNKKVCLLSDTTSGNPQDKETRDYMAAELPNIFKAMAVLSSSPVGHFTVNAFLALKDQPIPIRMFAAEEEAKKWLKQYL